MDEINIHKAQPILKSEPVKSVVIRIYEEIGDFNILGLQDVYQSSEAKELEVALYNSLPGGTYDRLFAAICFRKASHFRVRHEEPVKNDLLEAAKAALKLIIDGDLTAGSELYAQIEQAIAKSEQP